jgi:hypothetical protein
VKRLLEEREIAVLRRVQANPGAVMYDIYAPLIGQWSKSYLYQTIKFLARKEVNLLRLKKVGRSYQCFLTARGKRYLQNGGPLNGNTK